MNKIEKAYNKVQRRKANRLVKWWRKNDYKVLRVALFWLWIPCLCLQKINDNKYKNIRYSDAITKKYLDKLMPSLVVHYEESPKVILFHTLMDYYGGITIPQDLRSNFVRKKSKKAAEYFLKFSLEVNEYLFEDYEIDGYSKMNINNWVDWDKAAEKFDWSSPYEKDYARGVVFYKEEVI